MKKYLSILLCIAILLSLCACGSARPSAQSVVEDALDTAINEPKTDFWGIDAQDDVLTAMDTSFIDEVICAKFVERASYEILSAEENAEGGTAVVTVSVTNLPLGDLIVESTVQLFLYMAQFISTPEAYPTEEEAMLKYYEIITDLLEQPDRSTVTTTVEVQLKWVEDAWVIENEYELGNALYGGLFQILSEAGQSSDATS